MINQRIEMRLPDDTLLIAEATENSDYPSINIYHQDASGDADEVVFAEYNPEKETGRKLRNGRLGQTCIQARRRRVYQGCKSKMRI